MTFDPEKHPPASQLISVLFQDNIIVVKDAISHPMAIVSSTKSRWEHLEKAFTRFSFMVFLVSSCSGLTRVLSESKALPLHTKV